MSTLLKIVLAGAVVFSMVAAAITVHVMRIARQKAMDASALSEPTLVFKDSPIMLSPVLDTPTAFELHDETGTGSVYWLDKNGKILFRREPPAPEIPPALDRDGTVFKTMGFDEWMAYQPVWAAEWRQKLGMPPPDPEWIAEMERLRLTMLEMREQAVARRGLE